MSRQQEQKGFFKTLFSKWWAWALVPVACIALIFTAAIISFRLTPESVKEVTSQNYIMLH